MSCLVLFLQKSSKVKRYQPTDCPNHELTGPRWPRWSPCIRWWQWVCFVPVKETLKSIHWKQFCVIFFHVVSRLVIQSPFVSGSIHPPINYCCYTHRMADKPTDTGKLPMETSISPWYHGLFATRCYPQSNNHHRWRYLRRYYMFVILSPVYLHSKKKLIGGFWWFGTMEFYDFPQKLWISSSRQAYFWEG